MSSTMAEDDNNYERMCSFARIQKLTRAVDCLVARDYVVMQQNDTLDELEKAVDELEVQLIQAEEEAARQQSRHALLRNAVSPTSHSRASSVVTASGINAEVTRWWKAHGAQMTQSLQEQQQRLQRLEEAMNERQGDA